MLGKVDRIIISMYNIERGIKFLLKDIENRYNSHKMSKNKYEELVKKLTDVNTILKSLRFNNPADNLTLDEIRRINLSVMVLYDNGDFNTINNEMFRTNNNLFMDEKTKDKANLSEFKKAFNELPASYQDVLRKVEVTSEGKLSYRKKGLDNIKFLAGHYLAVKYNFKKIKYENKSIDEVSKEQINYCVSMIESTEDEESKKRYFDIISYIEKYAKAEVIIDALHEIDEKCDGVDFASIKKIVREMIDKYNLIYLENIKNCALATTDDSALNKGLKKIREI